MLDFMAFLITSLMKIVWRGLYFTPYLTCMRGSINQKSLQNGFVLFNLLFQNYYVSDK